MATETVTYTNSGGVKLAATVTIADVVTPPVTGWPSATTAGFLGDKSKLKATKLTTITTAGTVLDGVNLTGDTFVNAPNVVIKNSVITGGAWGIEVGPKATNLIVQDCTFIGGDNSCIMDDGYAANVTYLRLNLGFANAGDGMKLSGNGRLIQDCYIHNLGAKTATSHNDGIQAYSGSNWTFTHNWITTQDTGCISMFQGQGSWQTVLIQGNYFKGGAFPLYLGGSSASGVKVLNNIIETIPLSQPGGSFGPYTDRGSAVFSGNTDATGKPIT